MQKDTDPVRTVEAPGSFDLEAYISNYSGYTKVARLAFIAEHCKELEIPAYKLAVAELKKGINTATYVSIYNKAGDRLSSVVPMDHQWQDAVDKKAQQQLDRLELELNNSKTNLVKESIRVAYHEIGDLYSNRGDLNNALKSYVRTRDYCGSSKHIVSMCLSVIRVAIDLSNFAHVINYATKAQQTQPAAASTSNASSDDKLTTAKLKAAMGIAELASSKYKPAAKAFLETPFELAPDKWSEVIAPADVALYGALCALATLERSELKRRVLDNAEFRQYLDTAPAVRALVHDFYGSRYAALLSGLQQLQPSWLLDVHLAQHVPYLVRQVRCRALVQFCSPFSVVDLHRMAAAFGTPLPQLERELAALIVDGSLAHARIDSFHKRLYARQTDQRAATYEKALAVGHEFAAQATQLQMRIQLLRSDLALRGPRSDGRAGGGMGGAGGLSGLGALGPSSAHGPPIGSSSSSSSSHGGGGSLDKKGSG